MIIGLSMIHVQFLLVWANNEWILVQSLQWLESILIVLDMYTIAPFGEKYNKDWLLLWWQKQFFPLYFFPRNTFSECAFTHEDDFREWTSPPLLSLVMGRLVVNTGNGRVQMALLWSWVLKGHGRQGGRGDFSNRQSMYHTRTLTCMRTHRES